jgi:hypothetical protein
MAQPIGAEQVTPFVYRAPNRDYRAPNRDSEEYRRKAREYAKAHRKKKKVAQQLEQEQVRKLQEQEGQHQEQLRELQQQLAKEKQQWLQERETELPELAMSKHEQGETIARQAAELVELRANGQQQQQQQQHQLAALTEERDNATSRTELLDQIVPPLEEMRREMKEVLLATKETMLSAGLPKKRKHDNEVPQWFSSGSWSSMQEVPWNEEKKRMMTPDTGRRPGLVETKNGGSQSSVGGVEDAASGNGRRPGARKKPWREQAQGATGLCTPYSGTAPLQKAAAVMAVNERPVQAGASMSQHQNAPPKAARASLSASYFMRLFFYLRRWVDRG